MIIKIIGFIAAFLTTTAFLPQTIKTWRSRSTDDLSPIMFGLFFFGIICWLIYGILINDLPIILANAITVCLAGTILFFILRNNSTRRVSHVAIFTNDIELMKNFYTSMFQSKSSKLYTNHKTNFSSYFISFKSGCRLELMHQPGKVEKPGYEHIAISVGHKSEVEILTEKLKQNGYEVQSGPRYTGDGYFESTVIDPEGNKIEITI